MGDEGNLLRSLRREIGAPKRVELATTGQQGSSSLHAPHPRRGSSGNVSTIHSAEDRQRLLEVDERGINRRTERDGEDEWIREDPAVQIFDPVWGPPDYPPGHKPRPCQVFGILCCPCCMGMGGARGEKNRAVWRRIRWRAAIVLAVIQIFMFFLSVAVNGGFQPLIGSDPENPPNPLLGPSAETLILMGAKQFDKIKYDMQLWRLFTPILLHGGLIHLFMNLFSQFRMGVFLEEKWGSRVWLFIYWVGGLGANLFSCVMSPQKAGVGASGAIYAIMGGWLAHVLCTWDEEDDFSKIGQLLQVVGFSLFGMAMSLAPIVDWAAHVGGFAVGVMLGWGCFYKSLTESQLMLREPMCWRINRLQGRICTWTATIGLMIMFFSIFYLVQRPTEP